MPSAPVPGAPEAALHFVIEQQNAAFVAKCAQSAEKLRRKRSHAAFALDRLHHDGGRARADRLVYALEARGYVEESVEGRPEAQLHLKLSGGGDAAKGAAVERPIQGNDLVATASGTVFASEFVKPFIGFGSAVAEKNFSGGSEHRPDPRGQLGLRTVEEEVRYVDKRGSLRGERFLQRGMGVAEGIDRDAGSEVEIGTAFLIPDPRSLAAHQSKREARVRGNDVPRIKFGGGRLQALGHDARC